MGAIQDMKGYFGEGTREVATQELAALRKADPEGFRAIADGIADGTFDYAPSGK